MTARKAGRARDTGKGRNARSAGRSQNAGKARTAGKAGKAKSRLVANRLILAGLVVLALTGTYGVASGLSRPMALTTSERYGPTGQLPVLSQLLACPAPGSGGLTGGNIALASAPPANAGSQSGAGPSGRVILTPLNPVAGTAGPNAGTQKSAKTSGSPPPGQLTVKTIATAPVIPKKLATLPSMANGLVPTTVAKGGLIISAQRASAQGLDVEQLGPDGQPTARCQAPSSDFWFVGPDSPKLHTQLYLLNTDSQPADANLRIQTDSGPLLGVRADSGISVPPHQMVVQTLDKFLGRAKDVALHVTTSTGRIVAAVRQTTSYSKPGIWLPAAAEPATTQVLTGLPSSSGFDELFITVPGNVSATVNVTAVTPRGSYRPIGGSAIRVLDHVTTAVQIPSLSGVAGSIKVSANVPVSAVLEVSGGPSGAPGAYLTGSDAITQQGVVAASPAGSAGATDLVLSDPGKRPASVSIVEAIPGAPLTGQQGRIVKIAAKSATEVQLRLPKHTKASVMAIIVTPQAGSGPVYAARLALSGGSLQTVLPVISSPTVVVLPHVRASLVTVLGSLAGRSS